VDWDACLRVPIGTGCRRDLICGLVAHLPSLRGPEALKNFKACKVKIIGVL
jgi:hypothetical protein